MRNRPGMSWINRSIVQVGQPTGKSQLGCKELRALDKGGYDALSRAAPMTPAELAAVLSGRYPFDPEPGDDLSIVEDWSRILARINEAVRRGELPAMPTLKEGITWAQDAGIPTIGGDLEGRNAPSVADAPNEGPEETSVSDFDPTLQELAEEEGRKLVAQGSKAPKKTVASNIKKSHNLPHAVETIVRRTRKVGKRR